MTVLVDGDRLLPDHFGADDYEIHSANGTIVIQMRADNRQSITLEASKVLSFRFSQEEVYEGYIEGSLNRLLVPRNGGWEIRYRDEDSPFGDFVRETTFYHLNIPDVGILECWAAAITRR